MLRWRKIQALGLTTSYKDKNSDVGRFLSFCFGLPFLKPEDVGDCFGIDFSAFQPNDLKLTEFTDYLVDNYISENSRFPPSIWAENTSSLKRTTNACESFHSRFNSSFYHGHPNIFLFITTLVDFQSDTYIKIRSVRQNVRKIYSAVSITNKKFLDNEILKLQNGNLSTLDFVKAVGNHFKIMK